jgi:hypothetical protein
MTRRRPNIPVADWDDDGLTSRIVRYGKLRARRAGRAGRAAKAAPTLIEVKTTRIKFKKLSARELCRYLAWAKLDPDFRIPAALIDAVALRITSKRGWAKDEAAARKLDAALRLRRIRAEADRVRAAHPRFRNNDSWVAKQVVKNLDGVLTRRGREGERVPVTLRLDTVRRQISLTR